MEAQTDKWTIVLCRIPLHTAEGMLVDDRLYEVANVLLDGKSLRCQAATLVMEANASIKLHLEILPRDLKIVMED